MFPIDLLIVMLNQKNKLEQTGTYNNNINLQPGSPVFVMIAIVVVILVLFLLITIYYKHRRGLKKMYANRNDLP